MLVRMRAPAPRPYQGFGSLCCPQTPLKGEVEEYDRAREMEDRAGLTLKVSLVTMQALLPKAQRQKG